MTELVIENGIVIDDVESVLMGIRSLSQNSITDLHIVRRFITTEKNTKFYIDNMLNSCMVPKPDSIYVWLDTGFVDYEGSPIFVSLLRSAGSFIGHMVGTIKGLANSVGRFFHMKSTLTLQKTDNLEKKYASKIINRDVKHIEDQKKYLLSVINGDDNQSAFALEFQKLGICFDDEPERVEPPMETIDETENTVAEEITIGLLLEKMESMQAYMDELLLHIESMEQESQTRILELQKKNDEYRKAIVQMRCFVQEEGMQLKEIETDTSTGHNLLGRHGKILVFGGSELGVHVMQGIAKTYGFEKDDFEFVDYDKAKKYASRVRREGKYKAIIMGACPHKTSGTAGYSSVLEMYRKTEGMPYTADARSKTGKLKVTKESFREALLGICANLNPAYA